MAAKGRSIALVIVGLVLVIVSLGADVIGIGAFPGIGWKQILGAAVGLACVVFGALGLGSKKP